MFDGNWAAWSNDMEVVLALGIYFAVWVVVIWGANYFNKNVG